MKCFLCPWMSSCDQNEPRDSGIFRCCKRSYWIPVPWGYSFCFTVTDKAAANTVCLHSEIKNHWSFCLHCFLGEGTMGSPPNSMVCIWQTGLALPSNNNVPTMLCTSELSPQAGSCLHFPIRTSSLWGLYVISCLMQLHDFSMEIEEEQLYQSWASQGCHREWKSLFQRRHSDYTLRYILAKSKPMEAAICIPVWQQSHLLWHYTAEYCMLGVSLWCHSPRAFCFYFRPPRGAWLCQRRDARTSWPSRWSWCARSGRSPGTPGSQWTVWPLSVCLLCKPGCPALQCQRAIACREPPPDLFWKLEFLTPAKSSPMSSAVFLSREAF